ncbi:hypothetical protein F4809DRAFT_635892 [Biscogniauxia mediterranea]|nr:hypothetical protein F4809DRAFT_635892 [Biscogniauxia mediterranea]
MPGMHLLFLPYSPELALLWIIHATYSHPFYIVSVGDDNSQPTTISAFPLLYTYHPLHTKKNKKKTQSAILLLCVTYSHILLTISASRGRGCVSILRWQSSRR